MFNIGIVTFAKQQELLATWIQLLPKEWVVRLIEPEELTKMNKTDLVLFIEESGSQMGIICEWLIQLKEEAEYLVWIWTTVDVEVNRLVYLKLGVDQIVSSQENPMEWVLMMVNSLKRKKQWKTEKNKKVSKSNEKLRLSEQNWSVIVSGKNGKQEIRLTRLEFQVMELLYQHSNETVTYEEVYQQLWNDGKEDSKMYRISNIIFHLRKKLKNDAASSQMIKTVRSKGYLLHI